MPNKTVTLITGAQNGGKTTALLAFLQEKNYPPSHLCGFISLANPEKTCYRLKDLFSGEERVALSEKLMPSGYKRGRFFVDETVYAWANRQVADHLLTARLAAFDELGMFELEGRGFETAFRMALATPGLDLVATVRRPFLQKVVDHYALQGHILRIQEL